MLDALWVPPAPSTRERRGGTYRSALPPRPPLSPGVLFLIEKQLPTRLEAGCPELRAAPHAQSVVSLEPADAPRSLRRAIWRRLRERRLLGRGHQWIAHRPLPVPAAIKGGVKSGDRLTAIACGLNRRERRILKSKRVITVPQHQPRGMRGRKQYTPEKQAALAKFAAALRQLNAQSARLGSPWFRLYALLRRAVTFPVAFLLVLFRRLRRSS